MEKTQNTRTETLKSMPNQRIKKPPAPPAQTFAANRPSYYIPTGDRTENLLLSLSPDKAIDTTVPVDKRRINEKKKKKKLTDNSNNLTTSSVPPVLTCRNQSLSSLHSIEEDLDEDFLSSTNITASSLNPPLPPILTKPRLLDGRKQRPKNSSMRRSPPGFQQIKVRIKSPKLAKKMTQRRNGLGKSFVVVKSSSDPEKDFRESMEEMIVENNLCSLKELEDLLAYYLALNSTEYHDLIVKVFKQIWFDLPEFVLRSL